MVSFVDTVRAFVASLDLRMAGATCLALDVALFALLAVYWDAAGRRRLFPSRTRRLPPSDR